MPAIVDLQVSTPVPAIACDRLVVVLVRPTRYDDEGYVVRHWRGTLPSNTLACLNGLTEDAVSSGALGALDVEVHPFDEAVDLVRPSRIGRLLGRPRTRGVVALAGVQTNQFPRACDLARQFKAEGFDVMIGGFHVSGSVAMSEAMPPECQAIMGEGVTLVLGEVEDHWAGLLRDAASGQLRLLYDYLSEAPDLSCKPLPHGSSRLQRKFALRGTGTIDAGRGCPFNCSFCTIINVQGRTMRSRGAGAIVDHVRARYGADARDRISHYFFTDDNFARNPQWEAIFDGLIALRRDEGIAIDFMMQVDTVASKIPGFIDKAARAGCVQVFIGMEALREDNLKAAGKRQNKVGTYRDAIARWHEAGILCHVGFIIGFPNDTYERLMEDVRTLRDELLVDQASFFMLTPLPGSRDHQVLAKAGVAMHPDYNDYDSFHPTTAHPSMSADEWTAAYRDAWTEFYSPEHMRRALLRQNPHTYWGMFKNFLWYRASMIEGAHPMVTGFFRLKDRRSRRPGFSIESRWRFMVRRTRETLQILRGYAGLLLEMHELWLATRIRPEEYASVGDLRALRRRVGASLDVKTHWGRIHATLAAAAADGCARTGRASAIFVDRLEAMRRALGNRADSASQAVAGTLEDLRVPSLPPFRPRGAVGRAINRVSLLQPPTVDARRMLTAYWLRTEARMRAWRLWQVNPFALAWNGVRDARNMIVFLFTMAFERF